MRVGARRQKLVMNSAIATAAAYDAIRSTLPQDAPLSPIHRQGGQRPHPRLIRTSATP
jgi:hypothetical protein